MLRQSILETEQIILNFLSALTNNVSNLKKIYISFHKTYLMKKSSLQAQRMDFLIKSCTRRIPIKKLFTGYFKVRCFKRLDIGKIFNFFILKKKLN